ncbi:DUF421 domain-containing protein [Halobacillus halophilus]|uniref:DUF421 domain-containing protein n=1 Tax=Halobacillus halophilus TaxID=1570 RepID=UPI0013702906|nr:DUF421 domain-containing protein [Halobacillus halophilus]MYL28716.1 DUF421 domain-containing protein [Halobacillus halophilus]
MNTVLYMGSGIVLFFILYILARTLGKKLTSQMTLFDFIAGITLGSMTATTFLSPSVSLQRGILGLALFSGLVFIIDHLTLKSLLVRRIFNSEATVLMKDGRIQIKEMKKARFTVDELIAELRKTGVFSFTHVEAAVLETDGTVSVLKKAEAAPVTPSDLNLVTQTAVFPYLVIMDGKVVKKQLQKSGFSEEWLQEKIIAAGYPSVEKIAAGQVHPDGTLYISPI